jgi:hypothetical protein
VPRAHPQGYARTQLVALAGGWAHEWAGGRADTRGLITLAHPPIPSSSHLALDQRQKRPRGRAPRQQRLALLPLTSPAEIRLATAAGPPPSLSFASLMHLAVRACVRACVVSVVRFVRACVRCEGDCASPSHMRVPDPCVRAQVALAQLLVCVPSARPPAVDVPQVCVHTFRRGRYHHVSTLYLHTTATTTTTTTRWCSAG